MRTHLYGWIIFIVLINFTQSAQSGLATWLAEVDRLNPAVRAAEARWRAAEARVAQAGGGWPDPMVGVNLERSSTRFDDVMAYEYMVEQSLPWPGRLRVEREVARLEGEAAGFEFLEVRRQARAAITAAAWNLWYLRSAANLAAENARLTGQLTDAVRIRFESGDARQTDWLRMRIEQERAALDAETMAAEGKVALAQLNALLDADPATPRSTDDLPPLPSLDLPVEQLQEDARQYCCILMAMVWREKARDLARHAARLEQRPMLSLQVAARQLEGSGSIDEVDTGVAVNVPWLWSGRYKGIRAEAEADYRMAQAELEGEVAMTLTEIRELYTVAETRKRTMERYEASILPEARALAEAVREAYPAGAASAADVIESLRLVLDAETTWRRETAAYAAAHAKLMAVAQPWTPDEVLTGLPLEH